MQKSCTFTLFFFLVGITTGSYCNISFNYLLKCNLKRRDVAKFCNPERELALYLDALEKENNYPDGHILNPKTSYIYPNIHPTHQSVLDAIQGLPISSICEVGAGCGEVSKYIYYTYPNVDLTCVEHSKLHFQQIKEHFEVKTGIIPPDIFVKAHIINDSLPMLATLNDNSYDLVFTCAAHMHIPFIPAVRSAVEIVRVSKRFILHVENKNDGSGWHSMAIITPKTMSRENNVGVDYVRLYESLGVKTIAYAEYPYPDCPGKYIVYLGEKQNN